MDEMYHNCIWCSFNREGRCAKSSEVFESAMIGEHYILVEDGKLSEAIEERLRFPKMHKLEILLKGYGISQKRQKEILQAVGAELEDFIPTMVEEITDSVGDLILNISSDTEGLELKYPERFYCKYFI